jgi:hypothetical protein
MKKKNNRYKSRFLHSDSGRDTLWARAGLCDSGI